MEWCKRTEKEKGEGFMNGAWAPAFLVLMKKIWIFAFIILSGDVTAATAWKSAMVRESSSLSGLYLYQTAENDKMFRLQSEPPVEIKVIIDNGGCQQIKSWTSTEEIKRAVKLFLKIRVGEETDLYVTDQYHSISFLFSDGEKVVFRLNGRCLEYKKNGKTELYQLDNIKQFWKEVT